MGDLFDPGLTAPELLIVYGGRGLKGAPSSLWSDIWVQRCTVYKERYLLAHVPKALRDEIKTDDTDMMYPEDAEEVTRGARPYGQVAA